MKKFLTIIFLLLFSTSVFGAKLYVGGEKYEKDGVIALLLNLIILELNILVALLKSFIPMKNVSGS